MGSTIFHPYAEVLESSINLAEVVPFSAKYGVGGVTMHLLKQSESASVRTKALIALNQSSLSSINQLMFKLLPDTSDEMRLLAFSILDGQEDIITKRINQLLVLIESKNLPDETYAKFEKELAMQFWELIYNYLISPQLEDSILNKALSHAEAAVKILSTDATIWVLLGKIYKHLNQYDQAEEAFNKAITYDIAPAQVLPYLAEIKFKMHDYRGVREYLNKSDTLLDIPQIAPVKIFWDKL